MITVEHDNLKLIFDPSRHIYSVNNIEYISVTTKIGEYFIKFDSRKESFKYAVAHNMIQRDVLEMWAVEADKGAVFGSHVHNFAECYLLGNKLPTPVNDKEEIYFANVKRWLDKFLKHFIVLDVEKIIFTPKSKIAGTFDLLVQSKETGKIYILDWKTNKQVTNENKWQNCINGYEKYQATDMMKFSLQLNMYKYILKEANYYDKNLDIGLKILYVTHDGVKVINISDFDVNTIFKE